jgi:hypothetical protein
MIKSIGTTAVAVSDAAKANQRTLGTNAMLEGNEFWIIQE